MDINIPEKDPKKSTIKQDGQKGILWGLAELYPHASESEKLMTTMCLLPVPPNVTTFGSDYFCKSTS